MAHTYMYITHYLPGVNQDYLIQQGIVPAVIHYYYNYCQLLVLHKAQLKGLGKLCFKWKISIIFSPEITQILACGLEFYRETSSYNLLCCFVLCFGEQ